MTSLDIAFAAVGTVAAASGLLAVTTRHVVHAALWLVVCLGAVAGCYLVLGAELVALVQLLVYVGAVVVLVLFALMLTRAPIGPNDEVTTGVAHRAVAGVLGGAVTGLLLAVLLPVAGSARSRPGTTSTAVAEQLFGTWVWPFEALSLLLLVALIAAFAVSRMARDGQRRVRVRGRVKGHASGRERERGPGRGGRAVIHLAGPYALAAVLAGLGTYGVLARRNAVLVLIGVELVLNAANVLLVATGSVGADTWQAGNVLTLFVITIAAAEVCVALAVVLAVFRLRGDIDLSRATAGPPADQTEPTKATPLAAESRR